jgi:nucleotide sugar dehydrogenase
VTAVDVQQEVVASVGHGECHISGEPRVEELLRAGHEQGQLDATADHGLAVGRSDVVVMVVPVMLTDSNEPDREWMDAATEAVARGLRPGTLVLYETTLPVGDTRDRYGPMLERTSGLRIGAGPKDFQLAFSPERVFSGRILADLATYPKLVGGVDEPSGARAVAFYRSVLDAEVWDLGTSETAEFAKLAETTYRDVNIALANEFAHLAERIGVDVSKVIRGANSQPYSHIHQPGIGVGGHCIPVYPHFLLAGDAELQLPRMARAVNDGQVARAVDTIEAHLGTLDLHVLVLGLTYRSGVDELAYSRGVALVRELRSRGADVSAADPLLADDEIEALGARPFVLGSSSDAEAIVVQTADPAWASLDPSSLGRLRIVYDGRDAMRGFAWPQGTTYLGVGYTTDLP